MTDGGIRITHPLILDRIRYHRFGALVTITNGIVMPERRGEIRKKIQRGKSLLEKAVGDSAEIQTGLVFMRNNQRDITDLDFSLQISDYDSDILMRVVQGLDQRTLPARSSAYLSEMTRLTNLSGSDYFMGLLNQGRRTSGMRGGRKKKYPYADQRLATIKDAIFQSYVGELFSSVLKNSSMMSLGAILHDSKTSSTRDCYTDIIIAADYADFKRGLDALERTLPPSQEMPQCPRRTTLSSSHYTH